MSLWLGPVELFLGAARPEAQDFTSLNGVVSRSVVVTVQRNATNWRQRGYAVVGGLPLSQLVTTLVSFRQDAIWQAFVSSRCW